jgi:hypothetical protein
MVIANGPRLETVTVTGALAPTFRLPKFTAVGLTTKLGIDPAHPSPKIPMTDKVATRIAVENGLRAVL